MGLLSIDLSPTRVILCNSKMNILDEDLMRKREAESIDSVCHGSSLHEAWTRLYLQGTTTSQCVPYDSSYGQYDHTSQKLGTFSDPVKIPVCHQVTGVLGDMCSDVTYNWSTAEETGTPARFFRILHFYTVPGVEADGGSEKDIMGEIYRWGPVTSGMKIYPDFYTFNPKDDIYEWDGAGEYISGHAVEIVGWGSHPKPYWIIKNSWGTEWGDGGYFRMARGINSCELEENVMTGYPDFFYPPSHKTSVEYEWGEDRETMNERLRIINAVNAPAGGIEPQTGYSRRIMSNMPWIKFSRPVALRKLPSFNGWLAGRQTVRARERYYRNLTDNGDHLGECGSDAELIFTLSIILTLAISIAWLLWKDK